MRLKDIFGVRKPIIGMIHLAGGKREKVARALQELLIFQRAGIEGAIIENYHGSIEDVTSVLKESESMVLDVVRGVNILDNPYLSFALANRYGAKFVQFDSVQTPDLDLARYNSLRAQYPNLVVLGGVGFKYTQPTGNPLEQDLREARSRCEAGTGIETPTDKLRQYRGLLFDFPLMVGAGVNLRNLYEQMIICDGAIIGTSLKRDNDTRNEVSETRCRTVSERMLNIREHS
jgi:hypothetical protein